MRFSQTHTAFSLLVLFAELVRAETPCELYDVTTVVHVSTEQRGRFEVHSMTNALGLPLDINNDPLLKDHRWAFSCEFTGSEVCSGWNSTSFQSSKDIPDDEFFGTRKYGLKLAATEGHILTPEFVSTHDKANMCVSMRYFLKKNKFATVNLRYLNGTVEQTIPLTSEIIQGAGLSVSMQLSLMKPRELRDQDVKIRLKLGFESTASAGDFVLRSVRECSGTDGDVIVVSNTLPQDTKNSRKQEKRGKKSKDDGPRLPKVGYGLKCRKTKNEDIDAGSDSCKNGGREIKDSCQCFPGFTGPTCEDACPPHRFGADCGGVCSALGIGGCKGIQLAAPGMEPQCARGYQGSRCDEECPPNMYGQACKLPCGKCINGVCNRFSGKCNSACARGYLGPRCDEELESANPPVITSVGFDYIEGNLHNPLDKEILKSYPQAEIKYAEIGEEEKSKVIALESKRQNFRLDNLSPGRRYYLYAILIHETGNFFHDPQRLVTDNIAETKCNECTNLSEVSVKTSDSELSLNWKISETCSYPCPRIALELEVNCPESEKTLVVKLGSNSTEKNLNINVPNKGTVRLRPIYLTKHGEWIDYVQFRHKVGSPKRGALQVLNKTSHTIDFVWTKPEDQKGDIMECEIEPLLCRGENTENDLHIQQPVHLVSGQKFTIGNLYPFAYHVCSLQKEKLVAPTITNPNLPSGPPKRIRGKSEDVSKDSVKLHWRDAECLDVNGIRRGFRIELYEKDALYGPADTIFDYGADSYTHEFVNLPGETAFEARIYVQNHIGYNTSSFLSVSFTTSK